MSNRIFKKRYRIVTDLYCGYECQSWQWWFPFWVQMGGLTGINTHMSIEAAKQYIENYNKVVCVI